MAFLDESGLAYLWNKIKTRYDGVVATFKGATSSTAGAKGLVPAPAVGQQSQVLKGDGTWGDVFPNNTFITVGDDVRIGDQNIGGKLAIQGANGETGIAFINQANSSIGVLQYDNTHHFNFSDRDVFCRDHRLIRDDEFQINNSTSGWVKMIGGIIIAWGRITKSGIDSTYFTYPIGFGDVYGAWACMVAGGSSSYVHNGAFCKNVSTTGCNVYANATEASEFRILIVGRE